ncbi:hypothetical protein [Actinocorallia aurantiaca]|uniref:Nucleotidyltransferase-like protein n=1 Tax=Actinocorallia aurantiaca TaxID=46204 RepID=A0ABP6GQ40_9ACTN
MSGEEEARWKRVDDRLRGYHGVGLADVLDCVGYLREEGDTVIAGGSLAWGLGNRLSDFDVVVVGAGTSPSRVPLEHWVKTLRVDAWTRSHEGVARLFAHASEALESGAPLQGSFGTQEEEQQLKLLHRLAFGLRVDGPPLEGVDVAVARGLLAREYAERARESVLIARLALDAGRPLAATTNARLAVEETLHMVLARRGVPFTGDKWLQERLIGTAPDLRVHHDRFSALPEPGDEAAFVEDALSLVAELGGGAPGGAVWSAPDLALHSPGGREHFLLDPERGGMWELSAEEAETWRGLSGRDEWRDCSDAETGLLVGLYQLGLAGLAWDEGVVG